MLLDFLSREKYNISSEEQRESAERQGRKAKRSDFKGKLPVVMMCCGLVEAKGHFLHESIPEVW